MKKLNKMNKEQVNSNPELVKVFLSTSGLGSDEDDCMDANVFDSLLDAGTTLNNVYVCGVGNTGYILNSVDIYGSYNSYNYNYNYEEEDYDYEGYNDYDPSGNNGNGGTTDPSGNGGGSTPGSGPGPGVSSPNRQPLRMFKCPKSKKHVSKMVRNVFDRPYKSTKIEFGKENDYSYEAYSNAQLLSVKAGLSPVENGFAINHNYGKDYYYLYSQVGGSYWTTGTKNFVTVAYGATTVYIAHTHPDGTNAAPSPTDIASVFEIIQGQREKIKEHKENEADFSLLRGSLITSYNGSQYLIAVDDIDKVKKLLDSSNSASISFGDNTEWKKTYDKVFDKLKEDGYSENDAQAYALAYVLESNDLGLKLMKRNDRTEDFRELKVQQTTTGILLLRICEPE